MYIKRKLLVHVRKWECAQLGNAPVGRAQKIVRKWLQPVSSNGHYKIKCGPKLQCHIVKGYISKCQIIKNLLIPDEKTTIIFINC